jgi:inosine-uridine nucleoside N-ribohydrolase
MPETPTIILDCDPGHDDAIAIVVAARHTNLLGITTVAGNAPLASTTRNAIIVRDLLAIGVPVHSGAERPLVAEPKHAGYVHGESGLDGADLPESSRPAVPPRASGSYRPDPSPTSPWRCAALPISHIASPASR